MGNKTTLFRHISLVILITAGASEGCSDALDLESRAQAVTATTEGAAGLQPGARSDAARGVLLSPTPEGEEHHVLVMREGRREFLAADVAVGRRLRTTGARPITSELAPVADVADAPASAKRDQLLMAAAAMPPDAPIRILAELNDVPFAWHELRNGALRDDDRRWVLGVRREQAGRITGPLASRLRALGASEVSEYWASPMVAATIRARDVPVIAAWSEIRGIGPARVEGRPLAYSAGLDAADGMGTRHFVTDGYSGWSNGRAGDHVRVGIVEIAFAGTTDNNFLNANHYGFRYPWNASRVRGIYVCGTGACVSTPGATSVYANHGTRVTQIIAGDIESFSDPNVSDPVEQRRRSGISPGSEIYYYGMGQNALNCQGTFAAIEAAIDDGVDILNMSFQLSCNVCSRFCDPCGLNTALSNAAGTGMLTVSAIGNSLSPPPVGTCDAAYPASRRDGLAVGFLHSSNAGQAAIPYNSQRISDTLGAAQDIQGSSSRGGMPVRLFTGGMQRFAVADLAAPGSYETNWYLTPPGSYGGTPLWSEGSSWAAATVTGAAAVMRHAGNAMGFWFNDARALLVNMLLMGDGYQYDFNGGSFRPVGFDPRSGAGRVHMHHPDDLVQPAGWGWHRFVLSQGQVATFPVGDPGAEDSRVRQWKSAMTWVESDYDNIADIILSVHNTCAPAGQSSFVDNDVSFDIRKRIVLSSANISGRCLEGRVEAWGIPAGQTRTVYVADYFHSGDPTAH
jgi:hypothetical protein